MSKVLLLREPSQGVPDRYQTTLTSSGYRTICVPVLETVHTNLNALKDIIREPKAFRGVIITSRRVCDAWKLALADLAESPHEDREGVARWSTVPFYVVGQATASALKELESLYAGIGFCRLDIRGESSGTAEQLGHFILNDRTSRSGQLLYLTGDKNRDTLPNILPGGGIELHPLRVYETQGSSTFEQELLVALESFPKDYSAWWIVYFAPSAAEFVTPILRRHFDFSLSEKTGRKMKIASIGPTTATFLREVLELQVDAVASKPTPEELVSSIVAFDRSHEL
ncbi:uncharacterized protein LACBIDRAFT_318859 [Laccaria bicolor S238N-H82]|uniref:Predicted protein n=1 Tax=Laccaria bicolor (strain S238N-H82 / ATCC MYA-4686) TaxID=486041 RepID=B0D799_LACBS|nr:uncharacterized protein LACBIDRAFT_318859 [Laccaria bicolor S238N-H82]EDR09617.1 predicted protein [Laccaria bicolor S238N-H82]|eukprot:XP_001879966.1 predicted protein [Laccaria bicolor S238N-H82]